jgi:signal transduction histidine kinase
MDTEDKKVFIKILIFCSLLAALLIGFIVSFFKQQKKLNNEKIKAEINTSEEVKKKFATDLHDDLGPILATIKIYVNALTQKEISDKKLVKNLNTYLDLGISRVKAMANDLLPNTLQRKNLIMALEEYIAHIKTYVYFDIEFSYENFDVILNDEAKLNIYRIIQEIMTNTIKYSQAGKLKIKMVQKEYYLLITTIDNGVGFLYTDHNYVSSGYGISNIKSRVEVMDGTYTIFSRPGEGTKYLLAIPLKKICT